MRAGGVKSSAHNPHDGKFFGSRGCW